MVRGDCVAKPCVSTEAVKWGCVGIGLEMAKVTSRQYVPQSVESGHWDWAVVLTTCGFHTMSQDVERLGIEHAKHVLYH